MSSLLGSVNSQISSISSGTSKPQSSEFAEFQDQWKQSAPVSVIPEPIVKVSEPAPTPLPIEHHGTPLTGPELLLPSPVTHEPEPGLVDSIENIPERIGYLKQMGLEYGWGTSSPIQWVLEHIHIYTGLPWWGSVMVTAVTIRLILFPPQLRNSHATAQFQALKSRTGPLMEAVKQAKAENNAYKMAQLQKEINALWQSTGMSVPLLILPIVGQVTLGFGLWRNLRGMADIPIPALEKEHFLWVYDLTVRDPTFLLPLCAPIFMYLNMKQNASMTTVSPDMERFQTILRRALPIGGLIVASFQPAIVQLYFLSASLLNMATTGLTKNAAFRRWYGIAPLVKPTPSPTPGVPFSSGAHAAGINLAKSPQPTLQPTTSSPPPSPSMSSTTSSSSSPTKLDLPSTPPPVTPRRVSWLDRQIDSFKKSTKDIFEKPKERAKMSRADKIRQVERERAEKFEDQRKREIEADRRRRNEQSRRNFAMQPTSGMERSAK